MILSNERISTVLNKVEKDIRLIGSTIEIQPQINDVMFQIFIKFSDEKKRIQRLRTELKIGAEVQTILIEMFNITKIPSHGTLKHSLVHDDEQENGDLTIKMTVMKVSEKVSVLKADPFSYYAIEDSKVCRFRYIGPEDVLYNHTSRCVKELYAEEISNDIIFSEGCIKRQPIEQLKRFEAQDCHKISRINVTKPRIQFKHNGHHLLINCQGHHIRIGNTTNGCPNFVFAVED